MGMGKGMDGHAGKDLLVKVPCGTLVWRVAPGSGLGKEPAALPPTGAALPASSAHRPLFRTAASVQALEVDLSEEGQEARTHQYTAKPKGELVADLTTHGQRFILCKGGRGGLGNRARRGRALRDRSAREHA